MFGHVTFFAGGDTVGEVVAFLAVESIDTVEAFDGVAPDAPREPCRRGRGGAAVVTLPAYKVRKLLIGEIPRKAARSRIPFIDRPEIPYNPDRT